MLRREMRLGPGKGEMREDRQQMRQGEFVMQGIKEPDRIREKGSKHP